MFFAVNYRSERSYSAGLLLPEQSFFDSSPFLHGPAHEFGHQINRGNGDSLLFTGAEMKPSVKRLIEKANTKDFLGKLVSAVHWDNGDVIEGTVVSASNSLLIVAFPNGKFPPKERKFRRESGTELGGVFHLNLSDLLKPSIADSPVRAREA